jgi:hypothetical protein
MRIVTVARKPCSASSTTANVVEHEAGALNIDEIRIGFQSEQDKKAAFPGGATTSRQVVGGGLGAGWREHDRGEFSAQQHSAGRWPANVLLVHRPGCRIVGTRKVATGKAHRSKSGGRMIFSETEKPPMEDMTYADADGKETIPDWRCEPGCPVADIDRQSGTLTSGTGAVKRASSRDGHGNRASAYGAESRREGEPQICYGDSGGASRFFRQFKAR